MRTNLRRHRTNGHSNEKGQSTLELAFTLPLLVLLLLGIVDYSRAIHAQSIITNMGREAANLVARANVNLSGNELVDFQNVMNLIARTAEPLDMLHQGMMYISKVERVNNANVTTWLAWNGNPTLTPMPTRNAPLGGMTLSAGQIVYVVEVYYHYESLFPVNVLPPTLYSYSIF